MKSVCVLSGGMDSTTLLYRLLTEREEVRAISFNYGQRHKKELQFAKATCEKLSVPHTIVELDFLRQLLSRSALTSDIAVPEGHYEDESMKLTVVPNRNMIMASIAIGYAVNLEFDEVALGVHAGDHAIYPDCRPEFIQRLSAIADIANYRPIKIYAPFIGLDKGDIAIQGKKLGVDYAFSWTCYKGLDTPCGLCGACQERAEAFKKADMNDPLLRRQDVGY